MPIYEYNGVHYDIDTTDPVAAKDKILQNLNQNQNQTLFSGEGLPAKAMGAYEAGLATLSGAAAPFIGSAAGIGSTLLSGKYGTPEGIQQGQQTAGKVQEALTYRPQTQQGQQYAEDVGSLFNASKLPPVMAGPMGMVGLGGAGGKAIPQGAGYAGQVAGQAAKNVAMAPVNLAVGAGRGMAYPNGTSPNTALLPIRSTYVPHEQVNEFMAGQRPATSLTEEPTAPLYQNNPVTNWAYGMAPENAQGQKLVPAQGRFFEGLGENIGSGWRTNPFQAVGDIAGLVAGVGPAYSAVKSVPAAASALLNKATNFEPNFGPAREAALASEGQAGLQSQIPQTPLLTGPSGPVRPTPTMYVNPEGQATTNLQGTQVNYNPAPPRSPNFNQVRNQLPTAPVSPAELSQQVAASKIAESGPQAAESAIPTDQPIPPGLPQADVIAQIRARAAARDAAAKGQVTTTPVAPEQVTPPAPTVETPPAPAPAVEAPPAPAPNALEALKSKLIENENKAAQLREPMLGRNPAEMDPAEVAAYRQQMDQLGREHVDLQKQANELTNQTKKEARAQAREQKAMLKESQNSVNEDIIHDFAKNGTTDKLDMISQTIPVDISKDAYNGSNVTRSKANKLVKNGIDSIPVLEGMTESETIHAIADKITTSKKKGPSNVSQMLTEDTVFNTKQEWDKANLFNTLAGKKPVGGYKESEGIVRHERPDYGSVPDSLRKELPDISIVKRNAKGKRITE